MPTNQDLDILARTIFGEARGEYKKATGGLSALIAVANVVINRWKEGKRYGTAIHEVCLKPYQFSCWNEGDPNLPLLEQLEYGENETLDLCRTVATNVIKGAWPDLTKGANHYYASTLKTPPSWAQGHKPTSQIGQHLFFKL